VPGRAYAFGAGGLSHLDPPRAQGLGGAGAAIESDSFMLLVNPAAAARVTASTVGAGAQTDWTGASTGTVFGVQPFRGAAVFAGALYRNAGTVTLNASDGTSRQVVAGTDLLVLVGAGGSISPKVSIGFSLQDYRSELAESARASAILADAGIQIRVLPTLKIGAAIKHVGTTIKYFDEGVAAPTAVCGGIAWALPIGDLLGENSHLVAVADAAVDAATRIPTWRGGAEFWWHNLVILRAGGRIASVQLLGQVAAGVGLRIPLTTGVIREARLDYCVRLLNAGFETPHNLSMALVF
jgi:hypothetical protein